MELTPIQKLNLFRYNETISDLDRLATRRSKQYKELIKSLGDKANCVECGNVHWPLCEKQ